jgi:hypothetical protein
MNPTSAQFRVLTNATHAPLPGALLSNEGPAVKALILCTSDLEFRADDPAATTDMLTTAAGTQIVLDNDFEIRNFVFKGSIKITVYFGD